MPTGRKSSAQKQRDKKKVAKLADKKNKQDKLSTILQNLQKQKENHDALVSGNTLAADVSLFSAKNIGSVKQAEKRKAREARRQRKYSEMSEASAAQNEEDEASESSSEYNEPEVKKPSEGWTVDIESERLQPKQSYDYIQKITEMWSNKQKKTNSDDGKSDEEVQAQIETLQDERLNFINIEDTKKGKLEAGAKKESPADVEMDDKTLINDDRFRNKVQNRKHNRGLNQDQDVKLPVVFHEREIMENIENNLVTIVCGATGSGKSTQIPQFIYRAAESVAWKFRSQTKQGTLIGITQPRRVAAVSLAKRVSEEVGSALGEDVGYQIRYDSEYFNKDKTKIKFMTDGILLKEIESDFLLKHYSVIVIDEAHERSLNSDILISLLTRIAYARCQKTYLERKKGVFETHPLRLVIMSATLRVADFRENKRLFDPKLYPQPPKAISVDARQYPVSIHYNKMTSADYVEQAFKKVLKIHKTLPSGGILVFLTGKKEILYLQKRLKIHFANEAEQRAKRKSSIDAAENEEGSDSEEENSFVPEEVEQANLPKQVEILPLYSQLSPEKQYKVFKEPKDDCRLIVLATNVAETSITIPNMRYVVDSGKSKEKVFDKKLALSRFKVQWISQASAAQRAGRAGRTGPGHCYRLFSSALFAKLDEFSEPEILKTPLDQTMLQLKSIGVEDLVRFPYVTLPAPEAILASIKQLTLLGAFKISRMPRSYSFGIASKKDVGEVLENSFLAGFENQRGSDPTEITDLGVLLSKIPIDPKCGKILAVASRYGLLHYAIMIVACMSVQEIYDDSKIGPSMDVGGQSDGDHDSDLETQIDRDRKLTEMAKKVQEAKQARKTKQQEVRALREKYQSPRSELISFAKILSAYFSFINQEASQEEEGGALEWQEKDGKIEQFCEANHLHLKQIKEVHYLCLQLETMMKEEVLSGKQVEEQMNMKFIEDSFKQPSEEEERILQQAIISGLIQNLARKCQVFDQMGNLVTTKKKQKTFYESQESKEKLRIHHTSPLLYDKRAEIEHFVFSEIYALDKINPATGEKEIIHYVKGATKVENLSWVNNLASELLVQRGMPIHENDSRFMTSLEARKELLMAVQLSKAKQGKSSKKQKASTDLITYEDDAVKVFTQVYYGRKMWKLSIEQVALATLKDQFKLATSNDTSLQYYKFFAYLLLKGEIFPQMKHLAKYYSHPAKDVLEDQNMTPKVTRLLSHLHKFDVDNKAKLEKQWEESNSQYLQDCLSLWMKKKEGVTALKVVWDEIQEQ